MSKKAIHIKLLSLLMLFFTLNGFGAEIFFNNVYKGTGSIYEPQTNTISITTTLSGSGFKFQSFDSLATTFGSGNAVEGYLIYN
ncbi:MAG: hypothetical protein ACK5BK_03695, partial [Bacteroidota bacterium]